MIAWNFPPLAPGVKKVPLRAKAYLWLVRVHLGVCLSWRPDQCLKIEIHPFDWFHIGSFGENHFIIGPLNMQVQKTPFNWGA